jgi:hypothetical protein
MADWTDSLSQQEKDQLAWIQQHPAGNITVNGVTKNSADWVGTMMDVAKQRASGQPVASPFPTANGAQRQDPNAPAYEGSGNLAQQGQQYRPGVDNSPLEYINKPTNFEYGGTATGAADEAARYAQMGRDASLNANTLGSAYGQQYQAGMGQSGQSREQQMQGLGYLQQQINGTAPSVAQNQMNAGLSAARNQQASIAASARGGGANLAAAQQASANAAAGLSGQAVQQGSLLRAQETQSAMNAYGQQVGAMRQQDLSGAQMGQAGQQYYSGLGAQTQGQYESARQGVMNSQLNAGMAAENQNAATRAAQNNQNYMQQQANRAQDNSTLGTVLQTVGTGVGLAATLSDERAKTGIAYGGKQVDEALSALRPSSYEYKDEFKDRGGHGPQVGIMAQHLEASEAGKTAVGELADGTKIIKHPQAVGLALAGLARLAERLDKVEAKRAGSK